MTMGHGCCAMTSGYVVVCASQVHVNSSNNLPQAHNSQFEFVRKRISDSHLCLQEATPVARSTRAAPPCELVYTTRPAHISQTSRLLQESRLFTSQHTSCKSVSEAPRVHRKTPTPAPWPTQRTALPLINCRCQQRMSQCAGHWTTAQRPLRPFER